MIEGGRLSWGSTEGSCHLRDRRERSRWRLAGLSVIVYAVSGWWRREIVWNGRVGGRTCFWPIFGRGHSAGGIGPGAVPRSAPRDEPCASACVPAAAILASGRRCRAGEETS